MNKSRRDEIFSEIGRIIESDIRNTEEVYKNHNETILNLAQECWFLSMNIDLHNWIKLTSSIQIKDLNSSRSIIESDYRDFFEVHILEVISKYPDREFILRPAMECHKRGDYAVSAMIFFSQVDGILNEKFGKGVQLFHKKEKLTAMADGNLKLNLDPDSDADPINHLMWYVFKETLPICYTPSKREGYNGINRHTLLHGEALSDSNTELYSLKSLSLLSLITTLTDMNIKFSV